jgi:hypothetical protein
VFFLKRVRQTLAGGVAAVYLLTNVVGAHAAETGFWSSRRDAVRQRQRPAAAKAAAPMTVAALPAGFELPSYQPRVLGAPPSSETDSAAVAGAATRRLSEIDLPRWLADVVAPHGSIRDVHLSGRAGAPLVIHVQDLHDSVEAQRHIAGLLSDLQDARGVSLVGLEGAQGEFALNAFRSYPDGNLLRDVAEHLMNEGFLGGPEFAGLTLARPPLLWGIEDSKLYEANLAVVKESARRRPSLEAFTVKARTVLQKVKDRRLPARLMEFDRRWSAYQTGQSSLGDTVKYLLRVAPTPTLRYGNLHLLKDALSWEALLDKKKIESERALILDRLSRDLSREELDRLVAQSALYRLGRMTYGDFHRFFRGLCLRNGVALEAHEHFNNYIRYILLAERINRNDLFVELETLQLEVQNLLALTPEERRVMAAVRHLALLERLARHAYTPMDWRYHETHADALRGLGKEIAALAADVGVATDLVSPSEDLFRPFESFCGDAVNRNAALVRGLLDKMRLEKKTSAVLVAGGFHTDGLTHLLRQQGVSYAVVTPKVTGAPPASSKTLDLLASDPAPLEKLFAGETLNIPTPRLTALSSAKLPFTRRLIVLKASLLAALTIFATNAPLNAAAAESIQSWPVIEKVSGRARSPTDAVIHIQSEDGRKKRLTAHAGPAKGSDADYHGVLGSVEVSLDADPPASSLVRGLQDQWEGLFLMGILSRRRRAPVAAAAVSPAALQTSPYPLGRDPWGAREAGDAAILEAVQSADPSVHVFSGDFDLSAKNNASIGKIAVGSIQESQSPDLIAARGPAPFWEIRAALAAAMKEAGADIFAGAGGDEFRGVARGADAPERLARAGQRLNAHFVGRYQFFHLSHADPDNPAVQAALSEKVRRWVDARSPDGPYRLVRFGDGFTLVAPRTDRRWFASARLRRALGAEVRVRERMVERLGLGPFSVSMGVVSVGVAQNILTSVAGALADSTRALSVWVQRFANDALGEAKNRGRNQIYAPAGVSELTDVLKKGSVTVEHVRQLRDEMRTGVKTEGFATLAADGTTPVLPLSEFWKAVRARPGKDLDLYVFTVVRYTPTIRGAGARWINDMLRRVPARFRRFVPGSLLLRVDTFIQKRAFHSYQGSDYEKGNRAIASFVKNVTETLTRGAAGTGVLFGRSVDTVFAAVPRGPGEAPALRLGPMMEEFRRNLDAAEGHVHSQPRSIVYHVGGKDFQKLAATTGGVLDAMAHVEELLETYSREATAYLGGDLARGALRESLKDVFTVRAGANFLQLTYDPTKANRMMALYRKSQMEDAARAESVLFARAPQELGSLLYRGYARVLEKMGLSEHRARLWLGSRYAQAVIIPAVELFGLPGAAWLLSPLLGWGLAVVAGSAMFTLLHGLPGLTRGPPALRQDWGPFLARFFISVMINAAALSAGSFDLTNQILPVFELAGLSSTSVWTAYAAHAGWNFLVPEKYRLSLFPGDKDKVQPVSPTSPTRDALRAPKPPVPVSDAARKEGGDDGTLHVGLVELTAFLDEVGADFRRRGLSFDSLDREALHYAVRLAAPLYARTPRTDPYAPATPYEALSRVLPSVKSVDQLIGAIAPAAGPLGDALFGTAKAGAYLQGKVLARDADTRVDLIRAGAALEPIAATLVEMNAAGASGAAQLRDAFLVRGPPLAERLTLALRALNFEGRPSADEILTQIDGLYTRYSLTWAERGVLYLIAMTQGEGAGAVRGPPLFDPTEELRQILRDARAGGGIAENRWSETQRSLSQGYSLLVDFGGEFPVHLPAVRFAVSVARYLARFGGNERVLLAGLIAGVGIQSPEAGDAFWKYIERRGFGVQRVEGLRWIRELAEPWAAAHLVRYRPAERSLGAIRNQMGVIIQRLGSDDPDLVAQLLWGGKLAELAARTDIGSNGIDSEARRLAQEINDVHARFAERFGQNETATEILDEVFRLSQPTRYNRLKKDFQRVTGLSYEEAQSRFQKLIPEFEALLAAEGAPNAEVHGRVKGLYSISQKLANKGVSMADVKDLFGFYVAYENASAQPGAVRAALRKLNDGEFLEDGAETHIGADYSIHKIVSLLSPENGFPNARLEVQVFDSDDFLRSKEGVAARWVYGLGKEIKPSGWVRIDRMEYTGNLRDDLKHFQRRAMNDNYVYVNVELPDGKTVAVRMWNPPGGGLLPADAAAHWRVNALVPGYQGFKEVSLDKSGRVTWAALDEDKPLRPGAILVLLPADDARPDVSSAAMDVILDSSRRDRTRLMATLGKGEETLELLANQGRRSVIAAYFSDAPFGRVPDITDFEFRLLARFAKNRGFGGNVRELYAFLGLLSGPARDRLVSEITEYLTIDTVKARRGPAVGMTAVVNGNKIDLYREGYEIVEISGHHDRPAALLDVVKILKSYRIKVNDFIYLPQTNGNGKESYVIQLAVKARSALLDKALADMQQEIIDAPRAIEDPLLLTVEVIAARAAARSGAPEPDVEFLEALQETNIVNNVSVETLENGDVQMQAVVACPRGFLPFLESDLRNRFGDGAFVSVRKKNGLSPSTVLPVLLAPVLTGLVGLLSATPAYSAVETAAPVTMGLTTYLMWGAVVAAAVALVWKASPSWLKNRFRSTPPEERAAAPAEIPAPSPASPASEVPAQRPAVSAVGWKEWMESFVSRAESELVANEVLTPFENEQAMGFLMDIHHVFETFFQNNPSDESSRALRRAGNQFVSILRTSRYKLISQSALSLMTTALSIENTFDAVAGGTDRDESFAPSPADRVAFLARLESSLRVLNPRVEFKEFTVTHAGREFPVVMSDDAPTSYLRVGPLAAVRPAGGRGEGLVVSSEEWDEMVNKNMAFVSPGGVNYAPYLVPVLAAMLDKADRFPEALVEDDGAGNGLLTWAALRLGARRVVAIEHDAAEAQEMKVLLGLGEKIETISPETLAVRGALQPSTRVVIVPGTFGDWFGLSRAQRARWLGGTVGIRIANLGPHYPEAHREVLRASLAEGTPLNILGGYAQNNAPLLGVLFTDLDPRPYERALNDLLARAPGGSAQRAPLVERLNHEDGPLVFSSLVVQRGAATRGPPPGFKTPGNLGGIVSAVAAPLLGWVLMVGMAPDARAATALPGGERVSDLLLVGLGAVGVSLLAVLGYFGARLKREFFLWVEYRWPYVRSEFERRAVRFIKSALPSVPGVSPAPTLRRASPIALDLSELSPESRLPGQLLESLHAATGSAPPAGPSLPRPLWSSALRWVVMGSLFALLLAGSSPVSAEEIAEIVNLPLAPGDSWGVLLAASLGGGTAGALVLPRVFDFVDSLRDPFEKDNAFGDRLNRFLFSIRRNPAALEALSGSLRYLINGVPGTRQMALFRVLQRVEVLRVLALAETHTHIVRNAMKSGNRGRVAAVMATAGLELERLRADWRNFPQTAQDVLGPVDGLAGYFFEEIASDLVGESVARSVRFGEVRVIAERALAETTSMITHIRAAVVDAPASDYLPVMADTETIDMYELAQRGALARLVQREAVRARWQLTREMRADVRTVADRLLQPIYSDENKRREIWDTLSGRVDLYGDNPRLLSALRAEVFRLMSGGRLDGGAFEQNRALAKLLLRRIDAQTRQRGIGGGGVLGLLAVLAVGVATGVGGAELESFANAASAGWDTLLSGLGAGGVLAGTLSAGFSGGVVTGKTVPNHNPESDLQLYWLKLTDRLPIEKPLLGELNKVAVSSLVEIEMERRRWPVLLWFYSNRLREHGAFSAVNDLLATDAQSSDHWLKNVGLEFRDRLVIANARELTRFAAMLRAYGAERRTETEAAARRFRENVPLADREAAARRTRAAEAERIRTMETAIATGLPDDLAAIVREEFHRVAALSSAIASDEYIRVTPGALDSFNRSLDELLSSVSSRLMEIEYALAIRPAGISLERRTGSNALDIPALLERSRRDQKAMGWLADQARGFYGRFPLEGLLNRALLAWTPSSKAAGKSRFMVNAARARGIVAWMLASPQGPGAVTRGVRPYGLPHWTRWLLNAVLRAAGHAVAPVERKLQGRVNRVVRRLADPRLSARDVAVVSGASLPNTEGQFVLAVRDHTSGRVQVRIHEETLAAWLSAESDYPGYFDTILEASLRHALARAEGVSATALEEFGLSANGVARLQDRAIYKDSVSGAVARAHGLVAAARLDTRMDLGLPTVGPVRGPVTEALHILAPEGWFQPLSRVITLESVRQDVDEAGNSRREKLDLWLNGLWGETAKTEGRENTGPEWNVIFEASRQEPWTERRNAYESNVLNLIEREGGEDPVRAVRARLTRDLLRLFTEANRGGLSGKDASEKLDLAFGLMGRLHAMGGALALADDGLSTKKAELGSTLLPAFQDLDIRLLGELGLSWLGQANLVAALNRSAAHYSHAVLQGVRLREARLAFEDAWMRDGDVLIHVSRGMMNPDVDMTPSERTQLEQIHRIDATLDVLGEDASRKGRIIFLTEEGVSGELPEIVRAMGRKSQRAGVSNGFEALATHARVRGDKVFARSLAEHATRSEEKTRVDAESLFNTIPNLSNPYLFRLDQPDVSWYLGSWADRLAAELVAVMGGLVRDQARRVSDELRKEGVLRYQA